MKVIEEFEVKGKAQTYGCEVCWNDDLTPQFYCEYVYAKKIFYRIFKYWGSIYKRWKVCPPEEITFCELLPDGRMKIGFDTGSRRDCDMWKRSGENDADAKQRLEEFAKWVDREIVANNYGIESIK